MRAQRRIPDGNIRDPAAIVADSGTSVGRFSGGASSGDQSPWHAS